MLRITQGAYAYDYHSGIYKIYNADGKKWVYLRDVGFEKIKLAYCSTIDKFQEKKPERCWGSWNQKERDPPRSTTTATLWPREPKSCV